MSDDREDEPGFAGRWSRLKREAKGEAPEAEPAAVEAPAPVDDDRPDDEVLEELGLPDPDTLKPGDNFAGFMARAVPARLRNRALRKLWISDPMLANLDELLDYGEDFTDAATVVENLQTGFQVGKGFVDKVTELSKRKAGSPKQTIEESAEKAPEESAETNEEMGADDAGPTDSLEEPVPEETVEKAAPEEKIRLRQRMRFRLAEE